MLDSCVGCAVHSTLPAGRSHTTAELKVNFVRPLTDAVPLVRAGRAHHPHRPQHGYGGGPAGRPRRQAVRSRHHDLLHLRHPAAEGDFNETPPHDASRRRPAAVDRLLHARPGHAAAAHDGTSEQKYSLAFVGYGATPSTPRSS